MVEWVELHMPLVYMCRLSKFPSVESLKSSMEVCLKVKRKGSGPGSTMGLRTDMGDGKLRRVIG